MRDGSHRLVAALALAAGLGLASLHLAAHRLGPEHPVGVAAQAAFAPTCHQRPERALAWAGRSLPACARCTGLHLSVSSGALLLLLLPAARLPAARTLVAAGLAPMALDVVAGLCFASWDHPWLRLATGLVAGSALLLSLRARAGGGTRP